MAKKNVPGCVRVQHIDRCGPYTEVVYTKVVLNFGIIIIFYFYFFLRWYLGNTCYLLRYHTICACAHPILEKLFFFGIPEFV